MHHLACSCPLLTLFLSSACFIIVKHCVEVELTLSQRQRPPLKTEKKKHHTEIQWGLLELKLQRRKQCGSILKFQVLILLRDGGTLPAVLMVLFMFLGYVKLAFFHWCFLAFYQCYSFLGQQTMKQCRIFF